MTRNEERDRSCFVSSIVHMVLMNFFRVFVFLGWRFFIKATGDLSRTQALREACPSDFLFYSGDDETGVRQLIT